MKPKPFWPLNHFTTPVAILLSKGANSANRPHDLRAGSNSISTMSRGRWLGRDQQVARSNRMLLTYSIPRQLQGREAKYLNAALFGASSRSGPHARRNSSRSRSGQQHGELLELGDEAGFHPAGVIACTGIPETLALFGNDLRPQLRCLVLATQAKEGFDLGCRDPECFLAARTRNGLQQTITNNQKLFAYPAREYPICQGIVTGARSCANIQHEGVVDAIIVV